MDITPAVPTGRQIIEGYGDGRFRVSGTVYQGSVLVFPDTTLPWAVANLSELTVESLSAVAERAGEVEVLLLGCGPKMAPVAPTIRSALREDGIVIEPMDSGAACRTYNVLLTEERHVAAALIAVD